jgi:hypothetical protein
MNVGNTLQRQTIDFIGAGRGTRTPTLLPAADFESAASTDSAIPARDSGRECIRLQKARIIAESGRLRQGACGGGYNRAACVLPILILTFLTN